VEIITGPVKEKGSGGAMGVCPRQRASQEPGSETCADINSRAPERRHGWFQPQHRMNFLYLLLLPYPFAHDSVQGESFQFTGLNPVPALDRVMERNSPSALRTTELQIPCPKPSCGSQEKTDRRGRGRPAAHLRSVSRLPAIPRGFSYVPGYCR
jgi:hypothetical protein